MPTTRDDHYWMSQALDLAREAITLDPDDVPVGALILQSQGDRQVFISSGTNKKQKELDASAHAEIVALRLAGQALDSWRLQDTTLYTTLEPCPMCAEAILQARVSRVVFGAYDQVSGALGSAFNLYTKRIYPIPEVVGGIMEQECAEVLREIFAKRRERNA
ncbi:hypothetical protein Lal_00044617 [Lupinus albus]|nr:hypothetical protein Lal_00044617 [Lupinus albus]